MPIIFLREQTNLSSLEPVREVIDGQQRLRTLLAYIEPETLRDFDPKRDSFVVKRTHNRELASKRFSQLPSETRRQILNYEFSVHVLPSETDDREVLQIFARMNATGIKLNDQELRNAGYFGVFKSLMYDLAYEQLPRWRGWKVFSENDIARMIEVEETSDLAVVILSGVHGKTQELLNRVYRTYEESFPEAEEVERRFRHVMDTIDATLGDRMPNLAFSKKAMFHTLFTFYYHVLFGLESDLDRRSANPFPQKAVSAAIRVSNDISEGRVADDLYKVLRGGTADAGSRRTRFSYMMQALENGSS